MTQRHLQALAQPAASTVGLHGFLAHAEVRAKLDMF
jgi:hypothetical protein